MGATTLFQRCDCASSEVIVGFRGFGSEFEKKFTLATVEGAKAHHRVVQYQMGGLGMLVRFEVDAMVGEDDYEEGEEEDEEQMGSLRVRRVGYNVVPGDVVAEIKTRSINRVLDMGDVMPQLWFSETQWLLVAYHRRGAFWKRDMEQVNVERNGMLREWEEGNKGNLEKLVRLLKVVIEAVVEAGGRAELAVTEDGILRVSGSRGGDLVPGDIMDTLEM